LLVLKFGNAVGVFDTFHLGRIEVVTGKCDRDQFESMLAELTEIAAGLPFSGGIGAALPYDRPQIAQEPVLYHVFVYLRHVLSGNIAPGESLLRALKVILNEPHRLLLRTRRDREIFAAREMDTQTLLTAAAGFHSFIRVPDEVAQQSPLAIALRGHLPERVNEPTVQATFDTAENRFVRSFIKGAVGIIARMREAVIRNCKPDAFSHRILSQCDELQAALRPVSQALLWREIGPLIHVPANSTVLQNRRGYREVFRHFVKLRSASRVPISEQLLLDLLEAKDVAQLYELWTFFVIVHEVESLLGRPRLARRPKTSEFGVSIPWEYEVAWLDGARVLYNPRFSRRQGADRYSYSLPLRPDIAVEVPDGPTSALHLFDAKFRIDWIEDTLCEAQSDADEKPEEICEERVGSFKRADLYKMHTYRDAIPRARSVWIVYPGSRFGYFSADALSVANDDDIAAQVNGVGAIPVKPGQPAPDLIRVLRCLLGL
jgi:predicted component of viral defense system (DUF524 family)